MDRQTDRPTRGDLEAPSPELKKKTGRLDEESKERVDNIKVTMEIYSDLSMGKTNTNYSYPESNYSSDSDDVLLTLLGL